MDQLPKPESSALAKPELQEKSETKPATTAQSAVRKMKKPLFRDWQPLGQVRDSFWEQIKNDERRP